MMKDDAAMIADPDRWPMWPKLPLKRYLSSKTKAPLRRESGGGMVQVSDGKVYGLGDVELETGMLIGDPVAPITVYGGTIWDGADKHEALAQYDTPEALVADGWLVD